MYSIFFSLCFFFLSFFPFDFYGKGGIRRPDFVESVFLVFFFLLPDPILFSSVTSKVVSFFLINIMERSVLLVQCSEYSTDGDGNVSVPCLCRTLFEPWEGRKEYLKFSVSLLYK